RLKHYKNLWDPVIVLRDILHAISRAKDEVKTAPEYRKLAEAQENRAKISGDEKAIETAGKVMEIAAVYELYEKAKTEHNAVDFGDLIMLPAMLLEKDAVARDLTRLRHRHVLVDEYQDVNRASVRLLKALAGDGKNLWVVGDARQSIYRFRGASAVNMASFGTDFPGEVSKPLTVNYRSKQEIIETFSAFAGTMDLPNELRNLSLKAKRGAGGAVPSTSKFVTEDDEVAGIAASIKQLEKLGVPFKDQAVLCRTNPRIDEISQALEARGIPVLHLGSLFERDEVRDLLAMLSLATDRFGAAFARICASPRYKAPLQDVKTLLDYLRGSDKACLTRLGELASVPGLSAAGKAAIQQLVKDCAGLTPQQNPWDFLTTILLDRIDQLRVLASGTSIRQRMRSIAIWQFLNFLREQSPVHHGHPITTLLDRVRNLVLLAEERDLRQVPEAALQMNAVRLMTIHASKGLEFEAVHLPGLTVEGIPGKYRGLRCPPPEGMIAGWLGSVTDENRKSHDQEEECLFFVAMSRARTHLRIYYSSVQDNGNRRNPSAYLPKIAAKTHAIATPEMLPAPAGGITRVLVSKPADWIISDARMTSYEGCPRRFFYTHVLGIGTGRRTTPFERTHSVIHDLIRWLSRTRLTAPPSYDQTHAEFDRIWNEKGPLDHAFAADYQLLGRSLVDSLIDAGAGQTFEAVKPLTVPFKNGKVTVEPSEIARRGDGKLVIRRIRTGHQTEDEFDALEYFYYEKAAVAHYGAAAVVEALHLTDNMPTEVPRLTDRKLTSRTTKTEKLLGEIHGGEFKAKPNSFSCPRCPHFFICAAIPDGDLTIG
ncbi:MAG: ATP-dependent DNA helicase, partial [Candidatus Methylopumilus sp.]